MTEWLIGILEGLQGNPVAVFFVTMVIGMVPIVELRGAIPVGVALGLDPITAMIAGMIGNIIPVPFIILFVRKIFDFLASKSKFFAKIINRIEERTTAKTDTVRRFRFFGLWLFVAIPLPGTGGVTGSMIAAMMNMKLKEAVPSVALGIVTAGIVVTGITYGATKIGNINTSLTVFIIALAVILLVGCFVMAFGSLKKKILLRGTFISLWSVLFATAGYFVNAALISAVKSVSFADAMSENILVAVWIALICGIAVHFMNIGMKKLVAEKGKKFIPLFVIYEVIAVSLSVILTAVLSFSNGVLTASSLLFAGSII